MNGIVAALIGSGATGLIGWVAMTVRNRRKDKSDRISDLRLDVNQRFAEHREDMNRRFDEQRADSERRFAAILDEIKGLEHRLTGQISAQGDQISAQGDQISTQCQRIDGIYDVLRAHGERLTRIEAKLDIGPPAEAA